jgi:hypothetical protein
MEELRHPRRAQARLDVADLAQLTARHDRERARREGQESAGEH